MAIDKRPGMYPHVFMIDLKNNGVLVECAVLKEDEYGNMVFIELNKLDATDKRRMARLVTNRNAKAFPLWDLMSQTTLRNGCNALTYFNQLAQVLTPRGQLMKMQAGVLGVGEAPARPVVTESKSKKAANTQAAQ